MKIDIYIETTSTNFCHQMANYLHAPDKKERKTIFILKNTSLSNQLLTAHAITTMHYTTGKLPDTLLAVAQTLVRHPVSEIAIHVEAGISSFVLLHFSSVLKEKRHLLKPQIYETSIKDYALRAKTRNNSTLPLKLKAAIAKNSLQVFTDEELRSSAYVWHHFIETTYYLHKDHNADSSLPARVIPPLNNEQKALFSALYNIPSHMLSAVTELFQEESVYYCSRITPYHPLLQSAHEASLSEKLQDIRKGETANSFTVLSHHANDAHFWQQRCDRFLQLPSSLSFSAMHWLGIHPLNTLASFDDDINIVNDKRKCCIISTATQEREPDEEAALLAAFKLSAENIYFTREQETYYLDGKIKRIFYSSASMGDIIYGIAAICALRQIYPDDDIVFVTHKLYAELVDNCPQRIEHWDINDLSPTQQFELEIANRFSQLYFFERWEQILASAHMTDAFINEVIPETLAARKNATLSFDNIDRTAVDNFVSENNLTSGRVVLLHPNIGAANRTWPQHHWENLARRFVSQGWQVVLIGSDNNKYQDKKTMAIDIPDVVNAMNRFSITQTVYLMSLCQLLVACDSGPVALAGYTDIAISALYSVIPSAYRLPYRHNVAGWNAQGINVGCQYGQCGHLIINKNFFNKTLHKKWVPPTGKQFAQWCPNNKKYVCLTQFSDADWWSEIMKFIASDDFILNNKTP